jgi:hypothetical protein
MHLAGLTITPEGSMGDILSKAELSCDEWAKWNPITYRVFLKNKGKLATHFYAQTTRTKRRQFVLRNTSPITSNDSILVLVIPLRILHSWNMNYNYPEAYSANRSLRSCRCHARSMECDYRRTWCVLIIT